VRSGGFSESPRPPLRPKRSAYGLAGRSSGQGDSEKESQEGQGAETTFFHIKEESQAAPAEFALAPKRVKQ
jgi:hypothetical protein